MSVMYHGLPVRASDVPSIARDAEKCYCYGLCGIGLIVIIAIVMSVVIVATLNSDSGGGDSDTHVHCSTLDNLRSCIDTTIDTLPEICEWCFNRDGTGKCQDFYDAENLKETRLNCSTTRDSMCNAYGVATRQNKTACVSYTVPGKRNPCKWCHESSSCGCCWYKCPWPPADPLEY